MSTTSMAVHIRLVTCTCGKRMFRSSAATCPGCNEMLCDDCATVEDREKVRWHVSCAKKGLKDRTFRNAALEICATCLEFLEVPARALQSQALWDEWADKNQCDLCFGVLHDDCRLKYTSASGRIFCGQCRKELEEKEKQPTKTVGTQECPF
jgi:hypothetical protein